MEIFNFKNKKKSVDIVINSSSNSKKHVGDIEKTIILYELFEVRPDLRNKEWKYRFLFHVEILKLFRDPMVFLIFNFIV